jgi:cation:H+ antiporter
MLIYSVLFLTGLIVLLSSTKSFVGISQKIAHSFRLSPLVIGITIVAIGTSLPELVISTISSIKGDYGLALGNIVGSNITNVLFVLALGVLVGSLRIGTTKTPKSALILFSITILYIFLHYLNIDHVISGILLITLGFIIALVEYRWGIDGQNREDFSLIAKFSRKKSSFTKQDILYLLASLVGVSLGGFLLVISTENLSYLLGYSTTILGLCLTSVVTSFPELTTTLFSERNRDDKLALGNILGSNIYNIAFIGGISYLFSSDISLIDFDWMWLFSSTVIFVSLIFLLKGKYIPKLFSIALLIMYISYLVTTVSQ